MDGMMQVFEEARRRAPSVVVLDEAEALAGKRDGARADGQRRWGKGNKMVDWGRGRGKGRGQEKGAFWAVVG